MQRKRFLLSLLLSICVLLTSCNKLFLPTNADVAFENFTLNLFREDVSSNTLGLHYSLKEPSAYGIENVPITLGSFETDETKAFASIENCQAVLNKFSYKSLCQKNKLTYDILSSYLQTTKKGISYSLYEEPLSPVTGIHAQLPILLAEYSLDSIEDVETYLQLISTLPDYFASLISFEQKKVDAGLFMADYTLEQVMEQCSAFLGMGDENYLLSTFSERLNTIDSLTLSQKEDYILKNKQLLNSSVLPAYENLLSALQSFRGLGQNTLGLCHLPNGKNYYQLLVERESGSSRSVGELKLLIQEQIANDLLSLQQTLTQNPSLMKETVNDTSPSPDLILSDLKESIRTAFPTTENVTVNVKYVPSSLEEHLSPAFYLIPAIDNMEENVIYINQGHALSDIHLFTTLAHEGYPGHLYQTTYYASTNPDPLRTLLNFKGYVEGWATYAEMCSYYLSSLEKPYATILQKNSSLILGLYALADIGIHYDGWDLTKTLEFFQTYGIADEETIGTIYKLIIGDPANYLSYYVGYAEILELKKEMIEREKETFSQKKFHKTLLEVGPAPFEIVEKYLF